LGVPDRKSDSNRSGYPSLTRNPLVMHSTNRTPAKRMLMQLAAFLGASIEIVGMPSAIIKPTM